MARYNSTAPEDFNDPEPSNGDAGGVGGSRTSDDNMVIEPTTGDDVGGAMAHDPMLIADTDRRQWTEEEDGHLREAESIYQIHKMADADEMTLDFKGECLGS